MAAVDAVLNVALMVGRCSRLWFECSSFILQVSFRMTGDSPIPSVDSSVFFSETPSSVRDPLDVFVVNVGGSRYVLSSEMLALFPETRLGKLAFSRESALELCDDFMENEFFFDRNSQTFQ